MERTPKSLSTVDALNCFKDWLEEHYPHLEVDGAGFEAIYISYSNERLGYVVIVNPTARTPMLEAFTYQKGWCERIELADPEAFEKIYDHFVL